MVTLVECGESYPQADGTRAVRAELIGVLSLSDVSVQRRAIQKLLARVGTLVLDVSDLRIQDASAVNIFSDALLAAGGWPSARLVVAGPDGRVAAALNKTGVARDVHVVGNVEDAFKKIEFPPGRVSRREWLNLDDTVRGRARSLVAGACRAWSVQHLVGAAQIVVDEMIGSAESLSGTRGVLKISLDDAGLRIALRDFSSDHSARPRRGLRRTSHVCEEHGITPLSDGRVVWAVLADRH